MGNTTAATGKGFAIGSAVLTAAGLIAAFMDAAGVPASGINIREPLVLSGVLIGASLPFIFAAITMLAVGRSAEAIILEVRRQFTETPELKTVLHGKIYKNAEGEVCAEDAEGAKHFQPDYEKCISISTDASIKEMLIPGLMAVFMPVAIGFLLTSKGLAGMLVGSLSSGFMLAVTMSNAGGAWDNAKKYVEKSGAKGTDKHDATVVGDTVGDPFKDTSGPALNILIKLMSVISLVIAPKLKNFQLQDGIIVDWEVRGVIIGVVILILLILFSYWWQAQVDSGYKKMNDDLVALQEKFKARNDAKAKEAEEAAAANNDDVSGIEMTEQTESTEDKAE